MTTTVLVTGATGKTGRRLIPELLRRGAAVRAGTRTPAPPRAGVQPVRFDWFDANTYRPALHGVDAVYVVSPHLSDNVVGFFDETKQFLDDATEAGVRRLVYLSSFGMDQAPADDPLRQAELLVADFALPTTILRPTAFMQNLSENHWSNLARTIRERGELAMPHGDRPMNFVSTEDIAAVAAVALTEDGHEGKAYELTGPEAITFRKAAEHISTATGRLVRYVDPGPEAIRDTLLDSGTSAAHAEYVSQIFQFALTSGLMNTVTDDVPTIAGRPATTFTDFAANAAGAWLP